MRARFRVFGHPVHPMLVMFPVALFPLLLIADALYFAGVADWGPDMPSVLWDAGLYLAIAGLAATALAIVPGLVDLSAIPNASRAHRTALIHMTVGFALLALYGVAVWLRSPSNAMPFGALAILAVDVLGTLAVTAQGWLGGELVYKHHVGVLAPEEGADPAGREVGRPEGRPRGSPSRSRPDEP